MSHRSRILQCVFSVFLLAGLLSGLVKPAGAHVLPVPQKNPYLNISNSGLSTLIRPVVRYAVKNDLSPVMRELHPLFSKPAKTVPPREIPLRGLPKRERVQPKEPFSRQSDPVLQSSPGWVNMPAPDFNFEGLSNEDNASVVGGYIAPPDTAGAIGYDSATGKKYYLQWVNIVFAIWDVTGAPTRVYGPAAGNSLWAGFGGICESNNDGDVIVLFDELSNRWFMSQFALYGPDGHHQCVAVSQTADPTGAWYRYDFLASETKINDYPKFGVWPDAYYMTANQFNGNTMEWAGEGVWALERDQMLLGQPARSVYFDLYNVDPYLSGMLPSDLDGTPPPAGTPNYYVQFDDDAWGHSSQDQLQVWGFTVDWTNTDNSVFTHLADLATAPFDAEICPVARGQCIDQPNGQTVEDLADRLMFRLQYRNFGDHQALVVTHSVDVTNSPANGQAGIRWYEMRNTGAGWSIYQQGTYAPDGDHRWMGSIAMDQGGNIAVGYSVSSKTTYPSIRYAGRLAGDPLNTFPQAEIELVAGSYSQEGTPRWGDYSEMTLDPTDDCTFWYTQEYISGPNMIGWGNWSTRIGSFKYPTCTSGSAGRLQGTVTVSGSGAPIPNAAVELGNGIMTFTDVDGFYKILNLPVDSYDVTTKAYGFFSQTASGVNIVNGLTTTQDFVLETAPIVSVNGEVTDATHGWPLYARLDISTFGHSETAFTNPQDGAYNLTLLQDTTYTVKVTALTDGYLSQTRLITPPAGGSTEDFALSVNTLACTAIGYQPEYVYIADFEANDGGFTVSGMNSSWAWGAPTSGPGKAHSGNNVWATNLSGNYNDNESSEITSPAIDLSAYTDRTIIFSWWQWLKTEQDFDYANVDVSKDGGANWITVFGQASGEVDAQWNQYSTYLDSSFAVSNFHIRFHLASDGSMAYPGYYVDDVSVGVSIPPDYVYKEGFEASNGSYTISGVTSWEWGVPTRGPGRAHSGSNAWATNLSGNYNNNENGSLTSPDVDLSAYAGQSPVLSWWQWLQTEAGYDHASIQISASGGITWTTIYTLSGIIDTQWDQNAFWLDPSYMVSNFRIRFNLDSDNTVTYPGFYVDDVAITVPQSGPPTPPCTPLSGGLVVGNVHDANTGKGLNGAKVTADSGGAAISFATPFDPGVDEGFYSFFAPAGPGAFTAQKSGGYGPDVLTTTVVLNDAVQLDFNLPAGWLSAAPSPVEVTLGMSSILTASLTISNTGGLPANFELKERDQGMTPAFRTGAPVNLKKGHFTPYRFGGSPKSPGRTEKPIPIHAPPWQDIADFPSAIMDNAADSFNGKVYSVGGLDSSGTLNTAYVYDPIANAWSPIASMAEVREKPAAAFVNGKLYVVGGWENSGNPVATLEIYDPASDTWSSGSPIPTAYAAATGVSLDGQFYVIGGCDSLTCSKTDVFRYDPTGDTWTALAPYPEVISWNACGAIDGMIYCAGGVSDLGESSSAYVYDPGSDTWSPLANMPQTQWAAGFAAANGKLYISGGVTNNMAIITNQTFVYDPATGAWSPDANSNNTVYRGGSACGFYKIGGSTGGFSPIPSSEVYPGLVECGGVTDIPWLTTSPITGTIAAGYNQTIELTINTSISEVIQPGKYTGELNIKNDTPYKTESIPVIMNVNPPANWGKVTGLVTGLKRCDLPGSPLPKASIAISDTSLTMSNADGVFTYWMEEGNYTLTFSAPRYVARSVDVEIKAGETITHNIDLRLDAPCGSASPPALDLSIYEGRMMTATLSLSNNGAGAFSYEVMETPFDLTPIVPARLTGKGGTTVLPSRKGPASVLGLNIKVKNAMNTPLAPDSGWFGGLEMPFGLLRYAHAQCDEQPGSFYVISGVDTSFRVSTAAWRYDANANTWTKLAPIPTGSEGLTAVCNMGRIYVMGGGGADQFFIYDIASNTWSTGKALPRSVAGAAAGAWNGKVYLIGGDDDFYPLNGVSNQVNTYDITKDSWLTTTLTMPVGTSFPGYFQAGPYVYVVGGWGDLAPSNNVTTTLRFDMANGGWEAGPAFTSARSDFALALTDHALYAIAGDKDGNSFFDVTDIVERLDLNAWPAGDWEKTSDPLPLTLSANNAGYCADIFGESAIWSVGGGDPNTQTIYGANLFHQQANEKCYSIYSDVPWLSESSRITVIPGDDGTQVTITIDASNLPPGVYHATLVLKTNDPGAPLIVVPVTVTVKPLYFWYLPTVRK